MQNLKKKKKTNQEFCSWDQLQEMIFAGEIPAAEHTCEHSGSCLAAK